MCNFLTLCLRQNELFKSTIIEILINETFMSAFSIETLLWEYQKCYYLETNLIVVWTLNIMNICLPQLSLQTVLSDLPPTSNFQFQNSLKNTKIQKCRDTILIRPGCEIVERECQCWFNPTILCRENAENINRWDFANIEVSLKIFRNY